MSTFKSIVLVAILLICLGCPNATVSPPATPEQNVVAYLSIVCGSDTTKGANLDLTKTTIALDQMALIDKDTTRAILGYSEKVAGFCSAMSPIMASSDPWATRSIKIAVAAGQLGPTDWLAKVLLAPNPNAAIQAVAVAGQTVVTAIEAIVREVK